jgi:hypothetical protein
MNVAEIAQLKMRNVSNRDHTLKIEICLSADKTKGDIGRMVIIPEKLHNQFSCRRSEAAYI